MLKHSKAKTKIRKITMAPAYCPLCYVGPVPSTSKAMH